MNSEIVRKFLVSNEKEKHNRKTNRKKMKRKKPKKRKPSLKTEGGDNGPRLTQI